MRDPHEEKHLCSECGHQVEWADIDFCEGCGAKVCIKCQDAHEHTCRGD